MCGLQKGKSEKGNAENRQGYGRQGPPLILRAKSREGEHMCVWISIAFCSQRKKELFPKL